MEIVFLGTSSMVPTKDRNQYSLFISYKTEGILVDCGEGTQRQFKIAKIPLPKITKILITHWHGDHVLGLPGLIQTLAASRFERTLEIYGPKGSKKRFEHMYKTFIFDRAHDIKVIEVEEGVVFENNDFKIEAYALEHGTLCFGYTFIEKDKRKIQMTKAKKLGLKQGPLIGKLQNGESVRLKGKVIKPDDISKVAKGKKIAVRINSDFPSIGNVQVKDSSGESISYNLLSIPFYLIGQLHRLIHHSIRKV